MTRLVPAALVLLIASACASREKGERGGAIAVDQSTPEAAMRSMYDAMLAGDEAAYRKVVLIDPPGGYKDVQTSVQFEAIRLHQAVEVKLCIRSTPRATTQDRAERLVVTDFRLQGREMRQQLDALKLTVEGDEAFIEQARERGPVMRRIGSRWRFVGPADETRELAGDSDYARQVIAYERGMLAAIQEARRAVLDGEAKTIAHVNQILRKRIPKADDFNKR